MPRSKPLPVRSAADYLKAILRVALLALMALAIGACRERTDASTSDGIVVQREMRIKTVASPYAIAQMADGGFVIAGDRGTAWAVGTDSEGRVRWAYEEKREAGPPASQGHFRSVVALADGSALLCGEQKLTALLVKINPRGEAIERRLFFPKGVTGLIISDIGRCAKWGKGIAVIGRANDATLYRTDWVMALDANAKEEWETVLSDDAGGTDAIEGADGSLYMAAPRGSHIVIARIDTSGRVVAAQNTVSFGFGLLRPFAPATGAKLIAYDANGRGRLLTLDEQLRDRREPIPIDSISINHGRGFELVDNSLLMFGTTAKGGGAFTSPLAAAVARVAPNGRTHEPHVLVPPQMASDTVNDAIWIAPDELVAVRLEIGKDRESSGIVMSWIRISR